MYSKNNVHTVITVLSVLLSVFRPTVVHTVQSIVSHLNLKYQDTLLSV